MILPASEGAALSCYAGWVGCCVLGSARALWEAGTLEPGPVLERARRTLCSAPELLGCSRRCVPSALAYLTQKEQNGAHSQFKTHFCTGSKKSRLVTPEGF